MAFSGNGKVRGTVQNHRDYHDSITTIKLWQWIQITFASNGDWIAINLTQDDVVQLQEGMTIAAKGGPSFKMKRDGCHISVYHTNWGDPYEDGVRFFIQHGDDEVSVDMPNIDLVDLKRYFANQVVN